MGAPIGNRNNSKGKPITDELRKACVQEDWQRVRTGVQTILTAFAAGEKWAVEIVMDRMEGKPDSKVDITHHEGESLNDAQARNMAQEFLERAARTESVG